MNRLAIDIRRRIRPGDRRRSGMIFVVAMAIVVILSALVLAFAQSMRTEALASANRRSNTQADAIELGAEQWVLAQIEAYQGDAYTITNVPAQGLQVGDGYFWILSPDPLSDQQYQFGIVDENAKLNINVATSNQLMTLPWTLPQNVADAITDWRTAANRGSGDGAETSYYQTLTEPYQCKNYNYETVEEMLLVEGVTPQMLFGCDLNRDSVIDDGERNLGGLGYSFTGPGSGNDTRGVFNYLTCYSVSPGSRGANPGTGKINVNTAPQEVLMCLPGISQTDAAAIVQARQSNGDTTSTTWVVQAIGQRKYNAIAGLINPGLSVSQITGSSFQYSADIVAVSGDGRAFKRVRIVVDVQTMPAKILYRRDLTSLGWPLPASLRESLRAGKGIPAGLFGTSLTNSGTIGQAP